MRPLIFEYAELPRGDDDAVKETEYDSEQNLNVLKGTKTIAINQITFITDTFTKAEVDTSESDDDFRYSLQNQLDTRIQTRAQIDETGGDEDKQVDISLRLLSN